ncbi:MAG TPA: hypothetical protein VHM30_17040 [Gemmatimonadaceae bacterium]|nr:hypothetical protein [Gemmatimonadaceae bacterium]
MRALRLFALIALAACHDSTGPRPYGERIQLTARSVTATPGDTAHIRRVVLESNTITVVGRISTPDPCTQLAAYAKTQGSTIAFTVVATESRGGCVTSLGLFEYTLTAAAPSCPHVTVTHHYVGSNWPDQQVLDVGWICAYAPAAAVRPPGA